MSVHVPDRGHIVLLNFEPTTGREIGKRRPALVMSPKSYNRITGLALVCPITTRVSDYPFEVRIATTKTVGAALADRLRSVDWRARQCQLVEKAPVGVLDEARAKLSALVIED
jgi:mRNA interferase MazF